MFSANVSRYELSFSATVLSVMITLFSSTKLIFSFLVDFLEKQGFTIFQNVLLSAIHLTFRMFEIFLAFLTKLTPQFLCLLYQ